MVDRATLYTTTDPSHPDYVVPRNYPRKDPSPRQPHRSTWFNVADKIERQMQADGHRTWGYVIYRTTYASDDDWAEFLRRLRFRMEDAFDGCNGRDILDVFTLTVFSDPSLFDGADTPVIRNHFRQWTEDTYRMEQQSSSETSNSTTSGQQAVHMGRSPRYHFCIKVDQDSLRSVVHNACAPPAIDITKKGWVNLVSKSWIPIEEDPNARPGPGIHDHESIDGITEWDVGWMKVPYVCVMTDFYSAKEGINGWRPTYCRPPMVLGDRPD